MEKLSLDSGFFFKFTILMAFLYFCFLLVCAAQAEFIMEDLVLRRRAVQEQAASGKFFGVPTLFRVTVAHETDVGGLVLENTSEAWTLRAQINMDGIESLISIGGVLYHAQDASQKGEHVTKVHLLITPVDGVTGWLPPNETEPEIKPGETFVSYFRGIRAPNLDQNKKVTP